MTNKNYALIVLDSCRWDSFINAATPNMDKCGKTYKVFSPGNYTLPSHTAFFTGGTLPSDPNSKIPYVNHALCKPWVLKTKQYPTDVVLDGEDIIQGFNNAGYNTIGSGGVMWFDKSKPSMRLIKHFKEYEFFGTNLQRQIDFSIDKILKCKTNFFLFLNIALTHSPYKVPGDKLDPNYEAKDEDWKKTNQNLISIERKRRQSLAVEYIDKRIKKLLDILMQKNCKIIITADHGDCFGEDGFWGHNLYHEKVHEVFIKYSWI